MMKAILNAVRLQVQRALSAIAQPRIGSISSYDPNTMTARVALQPDGDLTGWLQVPSAWIGNQWGLFAPPNIGDLVQVSFTNGNINGGKIVGRYYNQKNQPLVVQSGEFWIVHKKGQFAKFTNDGKLTMSDGQGATITLNGDGTISSAGTWTHTGDITASGTVTGKTQVVAGTGGSAVHLTTHQHPTAATGSPSAPTPGT